MGSFKMKDLAGKKPEQAFTININLLVSYLGTGGSGKKSAYSKYLIYNLCGGCNPQVENLYSSPILSGNRHKYYVSTALPSVYTMQPEIE